MTQHRLERLLRYNPLSIDLTAEWEMQEKLRCPTFVLDELGIEAVTDPFDDLRTAYLRLAESAVRMACLVARMKEEKR
jgi:hypothetical protein